MVHFMRGKSKDSEKLSWFLMAIWISNRTWIQTQLSLGPSTVFPRPPNHEEFAVSETKELGWAEEGGRNSTGELRNGERSRYVPKGWGRLDCKAP